MAARAVADIIRTTLGPRAMLKMILDPVGGINLTNDGNTILREVCFLALIIDENSSCLQICKFFMIFFLSLLSILSSSIGIFFYFSIFTG